MQSRNLLFLLIGVLIAVSAGLGYALYNERHKGSGIDIRVGPGGISIEKK